MITEENGVFHIRTETYSYLFKIDAYGLAEHLHFGARVSASDADALAVQPGCGWGDSTLYREDSNANCMDIFPLEWSGCGRGDYRESPLELLQNGTPISTDFRYTGCEALKTHGLHAQGNSRKLQRHACLYSKVHEHLYGHSG